MRLVERDQSVDWPVKTLMSPVVHLTNLKQSYLRVFVKRFTKMQVTQRIKNNSNVCVGTRSFCLQMILCTN